MIPRQNISGDALWKILNIVCREVDSTTGTNTCIVVKGNRGNEWREGYSYTNYVKPVC